jgi:hypothetical protein
MLRADFFPAAAFGFDFAFGFPNTRASVCPISAGLCTV